MRARTHLTTAAAWLAAMTSVFWFLGPGTASAGSDGDLELGTVVSEDCGASGTTNCIDGATSFASTSFGLGIYAHFGYAVRGQAIGGDTGVLGISDDGGGVGVSGRGQEVGVQGEGHVGVNANGAGSHSMGLVAAGDDYGVFATGTAVGVYGLGLGSDGVEGSADTGASGVFGSNFGSGNGIRGQSTKGTGVLAESGASGTALRVVGKAQFSRSGLATVAGTASHPKSSVVVSHVRLGGGSMVLATPQKNVAGMSVQAAVPNVAAKTITIFLNKAVSVGYPVAWMVIETPF